VPKKKHGKRSILFTPFLALILLLSSACGSLEVGIERTATSTIEVTASLTAPTTQDATQVVVLETPTQMVTPETPTQVFTPEAPTATAPAPTSTPTPEEPKSSLWVEYRDARNGYGLALPCFWNIYPPPEGRGPGSPSILSYDEAFFFAHSIKGQWINNEWPQGAIKIEIHVWEGIDPATPLSDAARQVLSEDTIQSVEEVIVGSQAAVLVSFGDREPPIPDKVHVFRLSPDSLLLFSVSPRQALESPDVQGILESLARSPEEEIVIPSFPPSGPVEGREVYINEEAGYCFQYPTEFTLEEYRPSQPSFLGQIANLKVERPLYRVGMAVEVWRVGSQSVLEELVTNFENQFAEAIDRNPVQLVGGITFQLGGEPAEVLEGVPGPEGSRDIFALHADRLYHLIFTPSIINNPQAGSDVEFLFLVVTGSFTFLSNGSPPTDLPTDSPPTESVSGQVVYTCGPFGEGDICVLDLPSGRSQKIISHPADDMEPDWSPDGQQILFQSGRDGSFDLFVADVNGSNPRNLTATSGQDERGPDWSPDGSQILYEIGDVTDNGELWVMNADGGDPHQLLNRSIRGRAPSWSPDGRQIAFMRKESDGFWQIYLLELDSGRETKLSHPNEHCRFPTWSPDGRYIGYNTYNLLEGGQTFEVWRVLADGSGSPQRLTSGDNNGRPSWSPDGRHIIYNHDDGLYLMNTDGTSPQRFPGTDEGHAPDWLW
jgi:TolB protein